MVEISAIAIHPNINEILIIFKEMRSSVLSLVIELLKITIIIGVSFAKIIPLTSIALSTYLGQQ